MLTTTRRSVSVLRASSCLLCSVITWDTLEIIAKSPTKPDRKHAAVQAKLHEAFENIVFARQPHTECSKPPDTTEQYRRILEELCGNKEFDMVPVDYRATPSDSTCPVDFISLLDEILRVVRKQKGKVTRRTHSSSPSRVPLPTRPQRVARKDAGHSRRVYDFEKMMCQLLEGQQHTIAEEQPTNKLPDNAQKRFFVRALQRIITAPVQHTTDPLHTKKKKRKQNKPNFVQMLDQVQKAVALSNPQPSSIGSSNSTRSGGIPTRRRGAKKSGDTAPQQQTQRPQQDILVIPVPSSPPPPLPPPPQTSLPPDETPRSTTLSYTNNNRKAQQPTVAAMQSMLRNIFSCTTTQQEQRVASPPPPLLMPPRTTTSPRPIHAPTQHQVDLAELWDNILPPTTVAAETSTTTPPTTTTSTTAPPAMRNQPSASSLVGLMKSIQDHPTVELAGGVTKMKYSLSKQAIKSNRQLGGLMRAKRGEW